MEPYREVKSWIIIKGMDRIGFLLQEVPCSVHFRLGWDASLNKSLKQSCKIMSIQVHHLSIVNWTHYLFLLHPTSTNFPGNRKFTPKIRSAACQMNSNLYQFHQNEDTHCHCLSGALPSTNLLTISIVLKNQKNRLCRLRWSDMRALY